MILNVAQRVLIPFVILFGIYIIFHGHLTPGGGFTGGTVIAAAFILGCLNGRKVSRILEIEYLSKTKCISSIAYGLVMVLGTFFPQQMHRIVPKGVPGNLLSGGFILPLNIIVGISVACSLYIFFDLIGDGCGE